MCCGKAELKRSNPRDPIDRNRIGPVASTQSDRVTRRNDRSCTDGGGKLQVRATDICIAADGGVVVARVVPRTGGVAKERVLAARCGCTSRGAKEGILGA